MKINICSGYPLASRKGNSVTANRIARLLMLAGHDAVAMNCDAPPAADVQISLHAIKTAKASLAFVRSNPESRLFVVLTGTDIEGGIAENPELAQQVLDAAAGIVVAQPAYIDLVPERWQKKVHTIFPSVQMPRFESMSTDGRPLFTCVGHLRPVKNSHLMFSALQEIEHDVVALSLGDSLDSTETTTAMQNQAADKRYRWIDGLDRSEALAWMASSLVTINSSFAEGGANAVLEAIQLGVPVLASDIAGNRGFLGDDYLGYFAADDQSALAGLMQRCLEDVQFVKNLKRQLEAKRDLFSAAGETVAWLELFDS
jgi:glycosyltransferase involved in cell wall biosynthesis